MASTLAALNSFTFGPEHHQTPFISPFRLLGNYKMANLLLHSVEAATSNVTHALPTYISAY